jgi:hypothetical protein
LFSDVFVIPTYTFCRNQDFPDATGYAIKSGEEQREETRKSLLAILAILGVVALFLDRYDFLSLVAILAVFVLWIGIMTAKTDERQRDCRK